MYWQEVNSIQANCYRCGKPITSKAWVLFDKDSISNVLCDVCKNTKEEVENVTKQKKCKIVVKQISSLFTIFSRLKHYEILSTKNLMFESNIIDEKELINIMNNDNIDIQIKY